MAGEQPDQQLMEAAQAIALQTHAKELGEIIELGRTEFGTGNFDDASQIVADKLGPRTQEAVAMLRQFDFPHRLVAELANAPEKLEKLAKMPAGRLAAELAENRIPHDEQWACHHWGRSCLERPHGSRPCVGCRLEKVFR